MEKQRLLRFPEGFLWGTATSSHQYEGGNTNNQWYRWEQQGHIRTGERCGKAANWWEGAENDFAQAERMCNNALRLSLEWSRIEPREGQWDSGAIDRYRAMLTDLHNRGMKPMVTLHHFTEPQWFTDRGGFANEDNIRFFVRYVTQVVQNLHDLCDFWIIVSLIPLVPIHHLIEVSPGYTRRSLSGPPCGLLRRATSRFPYIC